MRNYPKLETKRLVLRRFVITDAPTVKKLAGDHAIADTTLNIPHPYEDGMAEEWIGSHRAAWEEGSHMTLAMVQKGSDELIGSIGLMSISQIHSHAELGYWVGRPFWNTGYCTEAGEAVLSLAFDELRLNRVFAHYQSRNPSSGRVMEKLGMKHEGRQVQHIRKWNVFEDIELYGILARDWKTG